MLFILPVDDVGRFFLFRFLDKRKTTFFSIPQILVDFIMLPLCLLGGLVKFVAFGLEMVNQSGNAGGQPLDQQHGPAQRPHRRFDGGSE